MSALTAMLGATSAQSVDLLHTAAKPPLQPRPYQVECFNRLRASYNLVELRVRHRLREIAAEAEVRA